MIWLAMGLLVTLVLVALIVPLYRSPENISADSELADIQQRIDALSKELEAGQLSEEAYEEARSALDKRVLIILDEKEEWSKKLDAPLFSASRMAIPLVLGFGTLGIYSMIGSPNFSATATFVPQVQTDGHSEDASLETMVVRLEQRLSQSENPTPDELILLARSYMALERYQDAFTAYEVILRATNNHPQVAEELERAREFSRQAQGNSVANSNSPGPSQAGAPGMPALSRETMEAANNMSDTDRQAMIAGMVDRLASRLQETPNDPDGWMRLIRARLVLGQNAEAQLAINQAVKALAENPTGLAQVKGFALEAGLSVDE